MGPILRAWRRCVARRHRRRIERALALELRGEVRRDGLKLGALSTRLEVEWSARDVHPWDRDFPPDRQRRLFAEQALTDADAVIGRCFGALPQIDAIALTVLEDSSGDILISGIVGRAAWESARRLPSVRQRFWQLGIVHSNSAEAAR